MELKLKQYHEDITDAWRFLKEHLPPEDTEKYWGTLMDDAVSFLKAHKSLFANSLIVTIIHELHRQAAGRDAEDAVDCSFWYLSRQEAMDRLLKEPGLMWMRYVAEREDGKRHEVVVNIEGGGKA